MRTIIAMTGASGSAFGVEFLKRCPGEKILIMSRWGKSVLYQETGLAPKDLHPFVDKIFSNDDLNAPVTSGSNSFDQLVVLPCSLTTMARIANGIGDNLVARTGEVALKENRRMILGVRETPLSTVALENALKLSRMGVCIMPISPAFYLKPDSFTQMVSHFVDHLFSTLNMPTRPGWRAGELTR